MDSSKSGYCEISQSSLCQSSSQVGVVVIGRNEGERLKKCLASVPAFATAVYVDSGSTDGSAKWVSNQNITAIELDKSVPFTAARGRNAGFRYLRGNYPHVRYVQFIDADCEMREAWLQSAFSFLTSHRDIAVVFGRLRERYPEKSIYNWLCDHEWDGPAGEARACGGIAMMRSDALEAVGGFHENLIAGEEPELCVRLRGAQWRIWRLERDMAFHDASMTRFNQWWLRAVRAGYAFAQGAKLHGALPERHYVWESRRAWLWGLWVPLACTVAGLALGPWGWAAWLIYPLQILRQTARNPGHINHRFLLAFFQVLSRFPEAWGQFKFTLNQLLVRQPRIIEHK